MILLVLLIGAAVGAAHGVLTARTGLAAFVVTLATFYLLQGVAFMISTTPKGQVTTVLSNFALDRVGPLPVSLAALAAAIAVVGGLLRWTPFGRHVYAVGGDPEAARANGVPVTRTLISVVRDLRRAGGRRGRRAGRPRHRRLADRGPGPRAVGDHRRGDRRHARCWAAAARCSARSAASCCWR